MPESYFKKLAEDLLTIEINTIVKSDMSATKLPSSRRQALYEVAADYHAKLVEYRVRGDICWGYAGIRSFGELRERAKKGAQQFLEKLHDHPSPDEQTKLQQQIKMLERIQYQSSHIVGMFKILEQRAKGKTGKGYAGAPEPTRTESHMESCMWNNDIDRTTMNEVPDLDLTSDQVTLIRKAWEIGTEEIQLQTVIQIDGDVTTRISKSFLKDTNPTLLEIHNHSIVISTGYWQSLVRTFGEIAGKTMNWILGSS